MVLGRPRWHFEGAGGGAGVLVVAWRGLAGPRRRLPGWVWRNPPALGGVLVEAGSGSRFAPVSCRLVRGRAGARAGGPGPGSVGPRLWPAPARSGQCRPPALARAGPVRTVSAPRP